MTKVYIALDRPWYMDKSWFHMNGLSICMRTEQAFHTKFKSYMNKMCKNKWTYDTELIYEHEDVMEIRPFIKFENKDDAIRFKLSWVGWV